MTDMEKQQLADSGVEVADAMHRFMGQEDIYISFLGKFLVDPTIAKLKECVRDGQVEAAFECAHTLKGVAANLSLAGVLEVIIPMVEVLRGGSLDGVAEQIQEFDGRCEKLKTLIEQF